MVIVNFFNLIKIFQILFTKEVPDLLAFRGPMGNQRVRTRTASPRGTRPSSELQKVRGWGVRSPQSRVRPQRIRPPKCNGKCGVNRRLISRLHFIRNGVALEIANRLFNYVSSWRFSLQILL